MRHRMGRLLLFFSLGLNVAFITLAAVHVRDSTSTGVPPRADFSPHWQGRRAAHLGRALRLEPGQRASVRAHLGEMLPALQESRRELSLARGEFRAALRRDDIPGARQARVRVSLAQTKLDSLSAEAMLAELATLRPEQRERYLRWTIDRRRVSRPPHE